MMKQNQLQMWPSFEIYLSMMTDSWMPWLEENRRADRFSLLLHSLGPVEGGTPGAFFRALMPLLRPSCFLVSPKFCGEVKALSENEAARVKALTGAFLCLPAAGHREKFYHVLTGFSLAGYEHWMDSITGARQGRDSRLYFQRQMMGRLSTLIGLPVFPGGAGLRDLELLYRVKAALCILYTRLLLKMTGNGPGVFPYFSARDKLQEQLSESGLGEEACSGIIMLYDGLTKQEGFAMSTEKPSPAVSFSAESMSATPEAENFPISQILADLNSGIKEVKQGLEILSQSETLRTAKLQQEPNRLIDTGTARRMLGISKSSMQRHRATGLLPFTKIGGKISYSDADVKRVIEEGKNKKKQP